MAQPVSTASRAHPCFHCRLVFETVVACARHMQSAHPDKNRLVGTTSPGVATPVVYGPLAALSAAQGPRLLDPAGSLTPAAPPLGSAAPTVGIRHAADAASREEAGDELERAFPSGLVSDSEDDMPDLMSDDESDEDKDVRGVIADHDINSVLQARGRARLQAAVQAARHINAAQRDDGMERGTVRSTGRRRSLFWTSTAARIRAYYEAMPETSEAVPLVNPAIANRPSRFASPALRGALRFSLTAGGSGLSEGDNLRFAEVIMDLERATTANDTAAGAFSSLSDTAHSFLTAAREEQARVLARLRWMQVPIAIGNAVYMYHYRDVMTAGLDALADADAVDFGDGVDSNGATAANSAAAAAASGHQEDALPEIDDDDESRARRGTLDGDMYQQERRNVRAVHGRSALVMGVQLHADEALVSWSGAHNIFPVRARFVNVVSRGGGWTTVGYIQHVPRAVGQSTARRLGVSDVRNDLLQRCLAVSLRTLTRASESGVTAPVRGRGASFLVPRIVGIVVDQPEERAIFAVMGNQCRFFCSPCMADKDDVPSTSAIRPVDRDVVQTLEAQLAADIVRRDDPRAARRRALGQEHSALAFVPALGAVHGLSTGSRSLYRITSFDLLHVWKLGILRLLAQCLPAFLTAICPDGHARLGPTMETLDVLNLRAFELDRNCKVCPSAPGYVCRGRESVWVVCAVGMTIFSCLLVAICTMR